MLTCHRVATVTTNDYSLGVTSWGHLKILSVNIRVFPFSLINFYRSTCDNNIMSVRNLLYHMKSLKLIKQRKEFQGILFSCLGCECIIGEVAGGCYDTH